MKKKIFIFGGCGFLGKVLGKLLISHNYNIIVIDKSYKRKLCPKNISFIDIDIRNKKFLEKLDIKKDDIIINLASRQYHDEVPFFNKQQWFDEVNYFGAKNLFEKAIESKASKYIFFSTDMVYGISNEELIREDGLKKPIGPYGKSKLKFENYLNKNKHKKIDIIVFRSRLISGPGRLGVFKNLFKLIKNSLPVPIIGDGLNFYQMVSVYDCADAILKALNNNDNSYIFNLGSSEKITVNDLIKNLITYGKSESKVLNLKIFLIYPILYIIYLIGFRILYPEQFRIANKNIILDTSEVYKILKWKPKYSDLEMIKQSYDYWLQLNK